MSNPDWYLDPPDEPEADICEDCGKEMEECDYPILSLASGKTKNIPMFGCKNQLCPGKFDGVAKEMAELIVYQEEMIEKLEKRIKYFAKKVEALEFHRDEG